MASSNGARRQGHSSIAELAAMVEAAEDSNSSIELRERMAEVELALEDLGWVRMGYETQGQLSRSGLRKLIIICRQLYLKHPLINHAVDVKTHYVWGQGISVVAKAAEVNGIIQSWWDLKENKAELTGHRARMSKERELQLTGNLVLAMFTDPIWGAVKVRLIDISEVEEIITNPHDKREPWFYHRRYSQPTAFDPDIGISTATEMVDEYYPDWLYQPDTGQRPAQINGGKIRWDAPVYHMKVGGLDNMLFGVPEIFPAIDWARAVQTDLENYATVRKALSKFAWSLTAKGTAGSVAAAKAALASTIGVLNSTGESNPAPVAGSTLIQREGAGKMEPIRTAGMQPSPDEGRRLGLMVSAGTGIPETMLWGDATLGNYATAKSLDRPTELAMRSRQQDWVDTFQDIAASYVVDQAALATRGQIKGRKKLDKYSGRNSIEVVGPKGRVLDRRVDISYPPILEHDRLASAQAVTEAATLHGWPDAGLIDRKTVAREMLVALGVNHVDEVLAIMHPDEPNPPATDPGTPAPVQTPAPVTEPPPPPAATEAAVLEIRQAVEKLAEGLARLPAQLTQGEIATLLLEATKAARPDLEPLLEVLRTQGETMAAIAARPVEVHVESKLEPAPPRMVQRTKTLHENAKGHITKITEVEEEVPGAEGN